MLYSIFIASREEYYRDFANYSREAALGGLYLDMTLIAAFAVCYVLAIGYRKRTPLHKRYMIGTALIILGPGLVRLLSIYELFGVLEFETYILLTFGCVSAIILLLLINDLVKRFPYQPYLVVLLLNVSIGLGYSYRMDAPWQGIASLIEKIF